MICEPYLCLKGKCVIPGTITWFSDTQKDVEKNGNDWLGNGLRIIGTAGETEWMRYADFEREKLKIVHSDRREIMYHWDTDPVGNEGYVLWVEKKTLKPNDFGGLTRDWNRYNSKTLINYSEEDFKNGTESSRLLKRAEFLKAVCEKENVPWIENKENHIADPEAKVKYGTCRPQKFCKRCWDEGKGCASCNDLSCPSNKDFCECESPNPMKAEEGCECRNTKGECWATEIDVCTCECHKPKEQGTCPMNAEEELCYCVETKDGQTMLYSESPICPRHSKPVGQEKPYPNRDCDITTCAGYRKDADCPLGNRCGCKCHGKPGEKECYSREDCEKGCAGPKASVNCNNGRYCSCQCHYGDADFCVRMNQEREWRTELLGYLRDYIDHKAIEDLRNRFL